MAEIHVERRTSFPIWGWVLGIIVLALIVWWIVAASNRTRTEGVRETRPAVQQPAPAGGNGAR
jgi:hypothetical protein